MTTTVIQASNVSKRFGKQQVLSTLNWQVREGQVIGLLGRNGSGKSTLLETALGLTRPDEGSVTLYGEPAADLSDAVRARIGYVPQRAELFEWMTPHEMLAYFKALYPHWNDARVQALLARWGFNEAKLKSRIGALSGGEKQRLAIIRALGHDPALLVLDEPVSALDPVGRRDFLRELVDTVIEGKATVVFSTHILSDLERVALDIAVLAEGRMVLEGELDVLLENARRIVGPAALLDSLPVPALVRRAAGASGQTSLLVRDVNPALAQLVNQDRSVRIEPLSLEELFVEVTQ